MQLSRCADWGGAGSAGFGAAGTAGSNGGEKSIAMMVRSQLADMVTLCASFFAT